MLRKKWFFVFGIFLMIFLAESVFVFAADSCCLNSKENSYCQDFDSDVCDKNCEGNCLPSSCSEVAECNTGCCFDYVEGLCTPNALKINCIGNENGQWVDDVLCQINECEKACCIIGTEPQFTTRTRCEKLSEAEGFEFNFIEDITDEFECTHLDSRELEEGACILLENSGEKSSEGDENRDSGEDEEESNCKLTTKAECSDENEKFYSGYLCSHPDLKSGCEKQASTNCVEGRDEIYWFDSCGNRENIYSSDKDESWNKGKILEKKDSCNPDSINVKGNCGNCNYELGSKCGEYRSGIDEKPKEGDYVCQDLNCYDAPGHAGAVKDRVNGESWCVYDGNVGDGLDVVGSEHYMYSCIDGEVEVEQCGIYRNSLCVQKKREIKREDGSVIKKVDEAFCKVNTWESCLGYNQKAGCGLECQILCTLNTDCMIKDPVSLTKEDWEQNMIELPTSLKGLNLGGKNKDEDYGGKTKMCVPKHPEGLYLSDKPLDILGEFAFQRFMTMQRYSEGKELENLNKISSIFGDESPEQVLDISHQSSVCASGSRKAIVEYELMVKIGGKTMSVADVCSAYPSASVVTTPEQALCENLQDIIVPPIGEERSISLIDFVEPMGMVGSTGGGDNFEIKLFWKATTDFQKILNDQCTTMGDCGAYTNYAGNVTTLGYWISLDRGSDINEDFLMSLIPEPSLTEAFDINQQTKPISVQSMISGSIQKLKGNMKLREIKNVEAYRVYATPIPGQYVYPGIFETIQSLLGLETSEENNFLGTVFNFGMGFLAQMPGLGEPEPYLFTKHPELFSKKNKVFGSLDMVTGQDITPTKTLAYQEIIFDCLPWQRPITGNCELCNEDKYKACTQYRCESLGMNCMILNDKTSYGLCTEKKQATGIPKISVWKKAISPDYKYEDISGSGFSIRTNQSKCIKSFSPVIFGVKTDIYSVCKMDLENVDFENMSIQFLEKQIYTLNHSQIINIPSVESLFPEIFNQSIEDSESYFSTYRYFHDLIGNFSLYIKCQSGGGEVNKDEYKVDICVSPGEDEDAPWILGFLEEEDEIILPYDATEYNISFYVNEPAECRWSIEDENYFEMKNKLECEEKSKGITTLGYLCKGTLDIPEKDEEDIFGNYHEFYFACRDQPWLGKNPKRNTIDGYWISLEQSREPLRITYIEPSGKQTKDSEPASVEIIVMTAGGAKSGLAECKYSIEDSNLVRFSETGGRIHSVLFSDIYEGEYNVEIICKDSAGNIARNSTSFELEIDNEPPEVTRFFYYPDTIEFYTNEESLCYYGFKDCNFIMEEGESIDYAAQEYHKITGTRGKTHYIKCKDVWGNKINNCSAIIKPFLDFG